MSDAMALLAGMVIDDGRRWGEAATGFQLDDARAVLEPGDDAPRLNWLGRSKGSSKTTDVAAMSLAWLVAEATELEEGFVAASDEDQAVRLLRAAARMIQRTPGLAGVVEVQARTIVHLRTRARVVALAADVAGTEGLLSRWLVADELPNWADTESARAMWTALFSSVPKVPGCRLTVIGHAGRPGSWQHRLFQRAIVSEAWRVNDVDGPAPWIADEALAEQEGTLLPSQFERRWLNRWAAGETSLALGEDVARAAVLSGPLAPRPGIHYVTAADLGVKRDRSVVLTAHLELVGGMAASPGRYVGGDLVDPPAGARPVLWIGERPAGPEPEVRIVVDRLKVWRPSKLSHVDLGEVERHLRESVLQYPGEIAVDPWNALAMIQRLRSEGVPISEFPFTEQSTTRLATTLFGVLRDGRLRIPNDAELVEELSAVRLEERSPGSFRLQHDSGKHDDQVIALALACVKLLERAPVERKPQAMRSGRRGVMAGR